jgi:phosphoglycolate phosphatase
MPFRTLILDFDGTLVSSLESIYSATSVALQSFGYPRPSLEEVSHTIGLPLDQSMQKLTAKDAGDAEIPQLIAKYRELFRPLSTTEPLFDGAFETISHLRSLGIQLILVSNKGTRGLREMTAHLKIDSFFDMILSANSTPYRKPDPRLFSEIILPVLAGSPAEVLVVGDSEPDLLFAKNSGLRCCWATYGYGNPAKCAALQPDFTIASIRALADIVSPAAFRTSADTP